MGKMVRLLMPALMAMQAAAGFVSPSAPASTSSTSSSSSSSSPPSSSSPSGSVTISIITMTSVQVSVITVCPTASQSSSLTLSSSPTSSSSLVCYEDNCVRAFQRFSSSASDFCATYTTAVNTGTYFPSFAQNCPTSPAALSSGCACLASLDSSSSQPTSTSTYSSSSSAPSSSSSDSSSPSSSAAASTSTVSSSPSSTSASSCPTPTPNESAYDLSGKENQGFNIYNVYSISGLTVGLTISNSYSSAYGCAFDCYDTNDDYLYSVYTISEELCTCYELPNDQTAVVVHEQDSIAGIAFGQSAVGVCTSASSTSSSSPSSSTSTQDSSTSSTSTSQSEAATTSTSVSDTSSAAATTTTGSATTTLCVSSIAPSATCCQLSNAGFENYDCNGPVAAPWVLSSGATIVNNPDNANTGSQYVDFEINPSLTVISISQTVCLTPGHAYGAGLYYRVNYASNVVQGVGGPLECTISLSFDDTVIVSFNPLGGQTGTYYLEESSTPYTATGSEETFTAELSCPFVSSPAVIPLVSIYLDDFNLFNAGG